jgi:hypothetical protein
LRVGPEGAIPVEEYSKERDWTSLARRATFLPYGELRRDWDWGCLYPFQPPLVVGDEIWIYYMAHNARNWWKFVEYKPECGIGLARLRLDGFVSVNADDKEGILVTKTLTFVGDSLEVNANADGGEVRVEVLNDEGNVIEGFSREDCAPLKSDSIRHRVRWNGQDDAHLLQARPIKLRFCLKNAKLYSFTPRILHEHYVPSYQ